MKDDITIWLNLIGDNKDIEKLILHESSADVLIQLKWRTTKKFCPNCGSRMYSKGYYIRTVSHNVMQDGRNVVLKLVKKKWKCKTCSYFESDKFPFVEDYKRVTNNVDFLIVQAFKDYNLTARQIAKQFNVSDTYALQTFDRYVDLDRLPLPEVLCVDEVNLNIDKYCKYALVLQDFSSGDAVDILPSRRNNVTEAYFASIPKKERLKVKYLVSDMFDSYQTFPTKYFPNAISIVDSFHVVKLINHKIKIYMNSLKKEYMRRDKANFDKRQNESNVKLTYVDSKEVYLLKHEQWLITTNNEDIHYLSKGHFDKHFGNNLMYPADYEYELFKFFPQLEEIRDLKELYIKFNKKYVGIPDQAEEELNTIIEIYRDCGYSFFEEVSSTLIKYKQGILNSFTIMPKLYNNGKYYETRLSNGPLESFNRIPKDMKRDSRGYLNFSHLRNRILYSTRTNAKILANPKPLSEVKIYTGKKRGKYKKHSNNEDNKTNEE